LKKLSGVLLNRIDKIEAQDERFQALLSLAPNLAPESIEKALKVAEKIERLARWHEVLIAMAPHFTHELFLQIIATPTHFKNREATLRKLVPHIPINLFADALKITREINSPNISCAVLGKLIPRIEDPILMLEALSVSVHLGSSAFATVRSRLQERLQQRPNLLPKVKVLKLAKDLLSNKSYYACAESLITLIPYISSNNLLLEVLKIARSIDDVEADNSRINALAVLNHDISENYCKGFDNNSFYANWQQDSEEWKRLVAEDFQEHFRWMRRRWDYSYDSYETNLAVWRAIGNEVIDKAFCQAPRSGSIPLWQIHRFWENTGKDSRVLSEP
jgi:hypothetical protein